MFSEKNNKIKPKQLKRSHKVHTSTHGNTVVMKGIISVRLYYKLFLLCDLIFLIKLNHKSIIHTCIHIHRFPWWLSGKEST